MYDVRFVLKAVKPRMSQISAAMSRRWLCRMLSSPDETMSSDAGFREGMAVIDPQPSNRSAGEGQRLQATCDLGGQARHGVSG